MASTSPKAKAKLNLREVVKEKPRTPTARLGPADVLSSTPSTRQIIEGEKPTQRAGAPQATPRSKRSKAEKSPDAAAPKSAGKERWQTARKALGKADRSARPNTESPNAGEQTDPAAKDASTAAPKQPPKLNKKEADYYPVELLNRGPISPRLVEHLAKKCGPPMQESCVNVRVDSKRPPGRLEETMASRHERVPPATVVLMFNLFEAGFHLEYGDISTIPDAEAVDIRSIRSHAVLGVVHIHPDKNAPLQSRIVFKV